MKTFSRRSLAANTAFAFAGDIAAKLGSVALVAAAAHLLSVDEFARWVTAIAGVSLLAALLDCGSQTLLTRDGASRDDRGSLFRALTIGRAPFAAALLLGAPLLGLYTGHVAQGAAIALLAIVSAVGLSLAGLARSTEDLRPEAQSRIAGAALSLVTGGVVLLVAPRSDALLFATAAASLVALSPLVRRARRVTRFRPGVEPRAALRRAIPLGLMGIATLVFYRSGTIALSRFSTPQETAAFAVAANIGFGLLVLPNAITSGLLPRLSSEGNAVEQIRITRRALAWTAALTAPVCLLASLSGPLLIPLIFGARYADAAVPLAVLSVGVLLIACSGIIGTALIAAGRLRLLGAQVAVSLTVNLIAVVALTGRYGAVGASLATIVCEAVGMMLLAVAAHRHLPGLLSLPRRQTRSSPTHRRRGVAAHEFSTYRAMRYFAPLDGLRAVAVLGVAFVHTRGNWEFLAGWNGVTLFFVLSGFLITTLAVREEDRRGALDTPAFFIRRCFRILPLYIVCLGVYVFVDVGLRLALQGERQHLLAALPYYLSPFPEWPHFFGQGGPFEIAWSLGVEEKFYILWPLLLFGTAALRGNVGRRLAITGFLALTFQLPLLFGMSGGRALAPYSSILVGCAVAFALHDPTWYRRLAPLCTSLGLAAATTALVSVHLLTPRWQTQAQGAFAVCAALVLVALVGANSPLSRLLSVRPLRFVGRISYAFYLLHPIGLSIAATLLAARVGRSGDVAVYALGISLTLAAAYVLHRAVELPMIALGRRTAVARRPLPTTGPEPVAAR